LLADGIDKIHEGNENRSHELTRKKNETVFILFAVPVLSREKRKIAASLLAVG
jgi:hypothetical protein